MKHNLFKITKIAKTDIKEAKTSVLNFVQEKFPNLQAISIDINSSKVSLNSVNGFIHTKNNQKYFFKFHAEEGEENTINEYYQSHELADAGLPIVKPIYENTEPGSQFLIYKEIKASTAFDEFNKLDERPNKEKEQKLLAAEKGLLKKEARVFIDTLEISDAQKIANAPLHQLFHTRLVSKNNQSPRLNIYYANKNFELPDKQIINFDDLAQKKWTINGINYNETLLEIINSAKDILDPLAKAPRQNNSYTCITSSCHLYLKNPSKYPDTLQNFSNKSDINLCAKCKSYFVAEPNKKIPTVLGHGDDHNGNKFYIQERFIFFDPAFAGRQPALLSFIKATAHNTLLHPFWFYEPKALTRKEKSLKLEYKIDKNSITINHNWDMEKQSPIRKRILDLQTQTVWKPLLLKMRQKKIMPKNYEEYIRKALFCCPFLACNLIDKNKYPSIVSLLALSKCVELGTSGNKKNIVDEFLNELKFISYGSG